MLTQNYFWLLLLTSVRLILSLLNEFAKVRICTMHMNTRTAKDVAVSDANVTQVWMQREHERAIVNVNMQTRTWTRKRTWMRNCEREHANENVNAQMSLPASVDMSIEDVSAFLCDHVKLPDRYCEAFEGTAYFVHSVCLLSPLFNRCLPRPVIM